MYNTEYTFRSSCSRIPTFPSRPSIVTPISRPVSTPTSVSTPIPISPPVSLSISTLVPHPVPSVAGEVNVTSLSRRAQPLAQGRRFVSWRISRKPFSGTLDHDPVLFNFVVAPFVLRHRPILDVSGKEVIVIVLRPSSRIQGFHPLSFLLSPLSSDVDRK